MTDLTHESELLITQPTLQAADAAGDRVKWNPGMVFWAKLDAGAAGAVTVTVPEQRPCNYNHPAVDWTMVLQPGETRKTPMFGNRFVDKDGWLYMEYTDHTDLTVSAMLQETKADD